MRPVPVRWFRTELARHRAQYGWFGAIVFVLGVISLGITGFGLVTVPVAHRHGLGRLGAGIAAFMLDRRVSIALMGVGVVFVLGLHFYDARQRHAATRATTRRKRKTEAPAPLRIVCSNTGGLERTLKGKEAHRRFKDAFSFDVAVGQPRILVAYMQLLRIENTTDQELHDVRVDITDMTHPEDVDGLPAELEWVDRYSTQRDIGPRGWAGVILRTAVLAQTYDGIAPIPPVPIMTLKEKGPRWRPGETVELTVQAWADQTAPTVRRLRLGEPTNGTTDHPTLTDVTEER